MKAGATLTLFGTVCMIVTVSPVLGQEDWLNNRMVVQYCRKFPTAEVVPQNIAPRTANVACDEEGNPYTRVEAELPAVEPPLATGTAHQYELFDVFIGMPASKAIHRIWLRYQENFGLVPQTETYSIQASGDCSPQAAPYAALYLERNCFASYVWADGPVAPMLMDVRVMRAERLIIAEFVEDPVARVPVISNLYIRYGWRGSHPATPAYGLVDQNYMFDQLVQIFGEPVERYSPFFGLARGTCYFWGDTTRQGEHLRACSDTEEQAAVLTIELANPSFEEQALYEYNARLNPGQRPPL